MDIVTRFSQVSSRIYGLQGSVRLLKDQKKEVDQRIRLLENQADVYKIAREVFQNVSIIVQEQFSLKVTEVANKALSSLFDQNLKVRLNYEVKRNQSEATIDLLKFDYETGIDPFEEDGGGLAIVLGFTLRMAVWALQTNKTLPLMILDEPFKFLDKEKQLMASTLIFELSSQLGLQIIGVSHEDVIIEHANNFYEVSQHQGVSYVKNRN